MVNGDEIFNKIEKQCRNSTNFMSRTTTSQGRLSHPRMVSTISFVQLHPSLPCSSMTVPPACTGPRLSEIPLFLWNFMSARLFHLCFFPGNFPPWSASLVQNSIALIVSHCSLNIFLTQHANSMGLLFNPSHFCVVFTVLGDESVVAPHLSINRKQKRITSAGRSVLWVQHLPRRRLGRKPARLLKTHSTKKTSTD